MQLDSAGRVGINTTTFADTATALAIKNGVSGSDHTFLDIVCDTNETTRIRFSEDGSTFPGEIRYNTLGHDLDFYVNSAPRMVITSNGNIGIGTDDPTLTGSSVTGLHIAGGNAGLKLQNTNNGDWAYVEYADENNTTKFIEGYRDSSGAFAIRPGTSLNATPGITLLSNGNIGIGTDDPDSTLHIQSPSGSTTLNFTAPSGQPNKLQFRLNS